MPVRSFIVGLVGYVVGLHEAGPLPWSHLAFWCTPVVTCACQSSSCTSLLRKRAPDIVCMTLMAPPGDVVGGLLQCFGDISKQRCSVAAGVLRAKRSEHDSIPDGVRADWHDRSGAMEIICFVLMLCVCRPYGAMGYRYVMRWQCYKRKFCYKCKRCYTGKHEHGRNAGKCYCLVA